MMAWVKSIVPIQVGINLIAEVTHQPNAQGKHLRQGISCRLAFAGLLLYIRSLFAFIMSHAGCGDNAPRILFAPLCPSTLFRLTATCRATDRLSEAWLTGTLQRSRSGSGGRWRAMDSSGHGVCSG